MLDKALERTEHTTNGSGLIDRGRASMTTACTGEAAKRPTIVNAKTERRCIVRERARDWD